MDFKDKRMYKRRAKLLFIISYSVIGVFAIMMGASIFIAVKELDIPFPPQPMTLGLIVFFSPIFVAMFAGGFGTYYYNLRLQYKKDITTYRQYVFFNKCLDALLNERYKEAQDIYNNLLKPGDHRDFLYGFGICKFLDSKEEHYMDIALKKITRLRERFDPKDAFK